MGLLFYCLLLLAVQQANARIDVTVRDANTREGMPGVPVTLTLRVPNQPAGQPTTLVTDPRGLAAFTALNPGNYIVKISADGLEAGAFTDSVSVDPGSQKRVEIPVREIATVSGRILDERDVPSIAAVVTLLSTQYVAGRPAVRTAARTTTDRDGRFLFARIPSGEFYLRIENQSPWRVAYHPGVGDITAASKLNVRGGDHVLGDIRLPGQARFKVSGTLIFSNATAGPGDVGRAVRFFVGHDNPIISEDPFLLTALRLPSRGSEEARFEFEGFAPGSYVFYPVVAERLSSRESVTVTDRDIEDLRIVVRPAIEMKGRIVMNNPQTRLPENLRVASPSRDTLPPVLLADLSREAIAVPRSGEFAMRNLMDGGRYAISVQGLPPDAYVSDIRLGNQSILNEGFFVAAASSETFEVQVGLPGGIVKGVVRDAAGQAVAASIVVVPDFPRRKNSFLYKRAATDARGQFTIKGLAPGEYQLLAWPAAPAAGAEEDPVFLGLFEGRSTRVRATAGGTSEAILQVIP